MGITKTQLFSESQNEIACICKALGHPARIAIIDHLLEADACINGDLVQELGLAQATISQHLKELKNLGIIKGTIEGASMSYCINRDRWEELKNIYAEFFGRLDSLAPSNSKECC
ncbi:ArsR/SmtB family transcription factor [Aureibacter tunicatorum]|uniref:Transcriptional regulator n=1 Tax=Aureibacter tunicatorum TaxID=866807 RepID=A0AAE3XLM5_9BACT|nr:metalloregulator ArsR/SmtB family transcription factor [Aureibacter tunicatorum]MDR6238244.1 putative transcriptional regulator [Aureibacter tunicatorum]BDD03277.1 transcriptional regulator [Aureibacter tunicatorum]